MVYSNEGPGGEAQANDPAPTRSPAAPTCSPATVTSLAPACLPACSHWHVAACLLPCNSASLRLLAYLLNQDRLLISSCRFACSCRLVATYLLTHLPAHLHLFPRGLNQGITTSGDYNKMGSSKMGSFLENLGGKRKVSLASP